ncbi:hypothetical protein BDW42DRAFT_92216 [Aspergillus taichungensis]|uniref:Uncharacterized protein n=1 Tax=Aspergillus taichungensis TaxID=482145 RepID=A0A2J5I8B4_9EURO|nr:hypothetical protein BDW42DRAFT_92216 [Aspergillus taichungensis]
MVCLECPRPHSHLRTSPSSSSYSPFPESSLFHSSFLLLVHLFYGLIHINHSNPYSASNQLGIIYNPSTAWRSSTRDLVFSGIFNEHDVRLDDILEG